MIYLNVLMHGYSGSTVICHTQGMNTQGDRLSYGSLFLCDMWLYRDMGGYVGYWLLYVVVEGYGGL